MSSRSRIIISVMLVVAVCGVGLVLWFRADIANSKGSFTLSPTIYALVRNAKDAPLLPDPKEGRSSSEKDYETMKRNEIAIVKSHGIIETALRRDNIRGLSIVHAQPNKIEWLEKSLQVDFPNDGDTLRIGMSGSNTAEMVVLVNAIVDAYVERKNNDARTQAADRADAVEKACVQWEEMIREKRKVLRNLSEIHKVSKPLDLQVWQVSLQDCLREQRRVRLERVAVQVKLAGKPNEKEEGAKPGSRRLLEEQLAILADQEKLLAQEEKELKTQFDRGSMGSFEVNELQRDIEQGMLILRRLREEKSRLDIENFSRSGITMRVKDAEVPNLK